MFDIKMILMDVDGVLTDGRIVVDDNGKEYKFFDVKDGHIIHLAMDLGLKIGWVSGRYSAATLQRAKELHIDDLYQGHHRKLDAIKAISKKHAIEPSKMAFIGDDLVDIPPMVVCGYSAAPSDAVDEVKRVADYVSAYPGGRGAVRDIMEHILKKLGLWERVLEKYLINAEL